MKRVCQGFVGKESKARSGQVISTAQVDTIETTSKLEGFGSMIGIVGSSPHHCASWRAITTVPRILFLIDCARVFPGIPQTKSLFEFLILLGSHIEIPSYDTKTRITSLSVL
jgi:hypothetical protein